MRYIENTTSKLLCVSYAKAVAIILMVVGHSGCPTILRDWIYMFHMPLFFFLSGYCFKDTYIKNPSKYVKRKIYGLYWPFVKWSILFLIMGCIISPMPFIEMAWNGTAILFSMSQAPYMLGGYWFLKELLLGLMIFYFFRSAVGNRAMVLGSILFALMIITTFFGTGNSLIGVLAYRAAFIIWAGYACHKYEKLIETTMSGTKPCMRIFVYCAILALIVPISMFYPSSFATAAWNNVLSQTIISLVASVAILELCRVVVKLCNQEWSLIRFIGDNTLTILTWHFLFFQLVSVIIVLYYHLPWSIMKGTHILVDYTSSGWWLLYSIVGIFFPLILAYLNKFIPNKWLKF